MFKSGWRIFGGALALSLSFSAPKAIAMEFAVYTAEIGEYMTKFGPSLDDSSGLMMEIAAGAFRSAGLRARVLPPVPWARAQADAHEDPRALLLIYARTPARENKWRWLSMIYVDKVYAYTMKGRPQFSSYEDIKAKNARAGVKLGSASESLLRGMGAVVDATPDTDKNFMKLMSGRVDVVLTQRMEADPAIRAMLQGRYRDDFLPLVGQLQRSTLADIPLWVVASPKTPEVEARSVQEALERFKHTPEYRALIRKYESRLSTLGQ